MVNWDKFYKWLGKRESGEDDPKSYRVVNPLNFLGKYQMGEGILQDLEYYHDPGGCYPAGGKSKNTWTGRWLGKNEIYSKEDFLSNKKSVQETAIREEIAHNWKIIQGQVSDSVLKKQSQAGLLAGAHLCGPWAVIAYLRNGTSAQDENGTKLTQYIAEGKKNS